MYNNKKIAGLKGKKLQYYKDKVDADDIAIICADVNIGAVVAMTKAQQAKIDGNVLKTGMYSAEAIYKIVWGTYLSYKAGEKESEAIGAIYRNAKTTPGWALNAP